MPYDFVSLPEEPRSFTAMADRDRLAKRGLLAPGAWHLTAEGHRLAAKLKDRDVGAFAAGRLSRGTDAGSGANRRTRLGGHADPAAALEAPQSKTEILEAAPFPGL